MPGATCHRPFDATKGQAAGGTRWRRRLSHWQLINPFWPDAQPRDTWNLAGAAAVIWCHSDRMFTREGAVTEVIPFPLRTALRPAG